MKSIYKFDWKMKLKSIEKYAIRFLIEENKMK